MEGFSMSCLLVRTTVWRGGESCDNARARGQSIVPEGIFLSYWLITLLGNPLPWNLSASASRICHKICGTRRTWKGHRDAKMARSTSKGVQEHDRVQTRACCFCSLHHTGKILPPKENSKPNHALCNQDPTHQQPHLEHHARELQQEGQKKQKVIEGVSTFCHLQGLNDQEAMNVLTQVFKGVITADQMRIMIYKLKQEQRCFKAAIDYIRNKLEIHNVSFRSWLLSCRYEIWMTWHWMPSLICQRQLCRATPKSSHESTQSSTTQWPRT